jgi:hypothetical protein
VLTRLPAFFFAIIRHAKFHWGLFSFSECMYVEEPNFLTVMTCFGLCHKFLTFLIACGNERKIHVCRESTYKGNWTLNSTCLLASKSGRMKSLLQPSVHTSFEQANPYWTYTTAFMINRKGPVKTSWKMTWQVRNRYFFAATCSYILTGSSANK